MTYWGKGLVGVIIQPMKKNVFIIIFMLGLSACTAPTSTPFPEISAPTPTFIASMTPFAPQSGAVTLAPSITPIATQELGNWDIPYSIPSLRRRAYESRSLEVSSTQDYGGEITYASFTYLSDGLHIYGRMSIPTGEGPFPVIVAIHGYNPVTAYSTPDYAIDEFNGLVREGYIVIHPNLRNYPPSDEGDNLYRVGMSIDVLNLLEVIKAQAGQEGILATADSSRLGLWAHSMGGEIALRVLTISSDIDAALLYAPLGGDTLENSQILYRLDPKPPFDQELDTPQSQLTGISPMYYFTNIPPKTAIRLFHGSDDGIVPVTVSVTTCDLLKGLGKNIECTFVPNQGHTFRSNYSSTFGAEISTFYETYLKGK